MARISEILPFLLENFSNYELSSGIDYVIPHRKNLKGTTGHRYAKPFIIVPLKKHIAGSGIPTSVISRYRSGKINLSPKSIRKLRLFYNRWAYHRLRTSGMSKKEALRHYRNKPQEVMRKANLFFSYIEKIAQAKKTDPFYILHGFRISPEIFEDWKFHFSGGVDMGEIYKSDYLDTPPENVPLNSSAFIPPPQAPSPQFKPYKRIESKKSVTNREIYERLRKGKGLSAILDVKRYLDDYTYWLFKNEMVTVENPRLFTTEQIQKILETAPSIRSGANRIFKAYNQYTQYLQGIEE